MTDPRDLHRRAGTRAAEVIERIPARRLAGPTPCTEWDVRAVINHITGGNLRIAARLSGQPEPPPSEDVVGEDPAASFRASFTAVAEAFGRPGVLDQVFPTPLGNAPGSALLGMRIADLTVHTWDLAVATGQPRDLDPEVAFAREVFGAQQFPRGAGAPFAAEQPVPEGATDADRLAAFFGREVPAA